MERIGWRVLAANYRCPSGEMDLIAIEPSPSGDVLVFVEVKTRRSRRHGSPAEAVDARKQEKLSIVAQSYLADRDSGGDEPASRFDIAEVFIGPDGLASVTVRRGIFGQG